ncbi:MAG TPA: aspartate/glutamate racemase family protein [Anaerolineales bacterium]
MTRKVAFLHTVPTLVGLFNQLSKEILPAEIEVFHVADEMLLKVVLAQGGLSPFIYRRVAEHLAACEQAGAAVVQVTCSSISPCVEASRPFVGIPALKVDEPMVDQALRLGPRIGVAATAPTTLKPTSDLVRAKAALLGQEVQVEAVLCEGAYAALFAGDTETHDRIVRQALQGLMSRSDVVILAQASMARILEAMPAGERRAPVLSSPRLAVERLAQVLAQAG